MDHEKTGDYGRSFSDYGAEASDYQTTMAENPSGTIDYDGLVHWKLCPLKQRFRLCEKTDCAWWDAEKERCAVLSMARNK